MPVSEGYGHLFNNYKAANVIIYLLSMFKYQQSTQDKHGNDKLYLTKSKANTKSNTKTLNKNTKSKATR